MKLLIIGASGVLGSRLYNDAIKKKWNVLGTFCSHEYEGLFHLDVRNTKEIDGLFKFFGPEIVVLAGGITEVDLCEAKPRLAEEVNIKGTLNLTKLAKKRGIKFIYISTDYVFDGKSGPYSEEDRTCPINVYGRTKLEAENIVKENLKDSLMVRTSQLYGIDPLRRNFTVKIIYNMKRDKRVQAADDFYSTPTYAGLLSGMIISLIEEDAKGIYNGSGKDFVNRYDYVNKIADIFSLDKSLIERTMLKDLGLKALRPEKGGLRVEKIIKKIDIKILNYEDYLGLFKKEFI